jgi:hypothetical protein
MIGSRSGVCRLALTSRPLSDGAPRVPGRLGHSLAGRTDQALDCVAASVANGMRFREWLAHDSNLDSIRDTPRFQAVMARL